MALSSQQVFSAKTLDVQYIAPEVFYEVFGQLTGSIFLSKQKLGLHFCELHHEGILKHSLLLSAALRLWAHTCNIQDAIHKKISQKKT